MPAGKHTTQSLSETMQALGPWIGWGWQFALTLGVLTWGGHWMDGHFETKVLFTLAGIFLGLAGGFIQLIRMVRNLPKPERHHHGEEHHSDRAHASAGEDKA